MLLFPRRQLPLQAFRVLEAWGCEHECFANPLNATLASYCSLHYDSDRYFGSLGSFFDFHPVRGNFEANPPFVIKSDEVEHHMLTILETAERNDQPSAHPRLQKTK